MLIVPALNDGEFERQFIDHPLHTLSPTNFCLQIEKLVLEEQIGYIEAMVRLCEEFDIPEKEYLKIITQTMKDKIEMEAKELHMWRE